MTRWHRWTGIVSALIVTLTTLTGIALNHTEALRLSERVVENDALNGWYGQAAPVPGAAFDTAHGWVVQMGSRVFLDAAELLRSERALVGAATVDDALMLVFEDRVAVVDAAGVEIDGYDSLDGLTPPLSQFAVAPEIAIETASGVRRLDRASGTWPEAASGPAPQWLATAAPPADLARALQRQFTGGGINVERVMLDLHSGRILGLPGVVLVDAAALCLLFLSLSGVYMWFKFKRGNGRGRRPPP